MEKPVLSPHFTIEDIHKVREYNYEVTKHMTDEERMDLKIKENIDFSFVNSMLRKQYCENFGRPAKEPEMMFKLQENPHYRRYS